MICNDKPKSYLHCPPLPKKTKSIIQQSSPPTLSHNAFSTLPSFPTVHTKHKHRHRLISTPCLFLRTCSFGTLAPPTREQRRLEHISLNIAHFINLALIRPIPIQPSRVLQFLHGSILFLRLLFRLQLLRCHGGKSFRRDLPQNDLLSNGSVPFQIEDESAHLLRVGLFDPLAPRVDRGLHLSRTREAERCDGRCVEVLGQFVLGRKEDGVKLFANVDAEWGKALPFGLGVEFGGSGARTLELGARLGWPFGSGLGCRG
mmetsp:Transcript_26316/g.44916  ORF Transcript_26316/g.44916 Transcript_26316/m.44916 type:complete len:259 (-) Transcript_26316:467-1243(-)